MAEATKWFSESNTPPQNIKIMLKLKNGREVLGERSGKWWLPSFIGMTPEDIASGVDKWRFLDPNQKQ